MLLLLEAQSSWTVNILIRILLYLAQSYHEFFDGADIDVEVKAKVIYESDTRVLSINILFSVKFSMNRESCMA